jgi:steroid delta-isomerase-like uncharacterized protein
MASAGLPGPLQFAGRVHLRGAAEIQRKKIGRTIPEKWGGERRALANRTAAAKPRLTRKTAYAGGFEAASSRMDRRSLLRGLAGVAAAAPLAAQADERPSSAVVKAFAATLSAHDLVGFAALFDEDYINHQTSAAAPPPSASASPKQATVGFFASRLKGLPDLVVSIEAMVAGDDMVAASFVYQGTQQGPLLGVPATGKRMRFTSCDIFRLANGKIIEHWGMGDIAGQLAQMSDCVLSQAICHGFLSRRMALRIVRS